MNLVYTSIPTFFFYIWNIDLQNFKMFLSCILERVSNKSVQILPFKNFTMYHMLNKSICMVIPT
jgi:hypothetical protein